MRTLGSLAGIGGACGRVGARIARRNGAACGGRRSASPPSTRGESGPDGDETPAEATRYVATVDRIVDGEHVVLLLEADGEPVAQRVVAADAHPDLEGGDILLAVVSDDELLAYRTVPERPSGGSAP